MVTNKQLAARITALEARITALEAEMAQMSLALPYRLPQDAVAI